MQCVLPELGAVLADRAHSSLPLGCCKSQTCQCCVQFYEVLQLLVQRCWTYRAVGTPGNG